MILRCVVFSTSQNQIVNANYEVETNNLPLQGLDPDLKVYGEYKTNSPQPFDSRCMKEVITQTMVESAHPVYPSLLTYQITYSSQLLTNPELQISIDNMESLANQQLMSYINSASEQQIALRLHHKKIKGIGLTQAEEDFLDLMDEYGDAMDENSDRKDDLYDLIEDHPEQLAAQIDLGWTTEIEQ